MRYVQLKTFVRKIGDEEVSDSQTIKDILFVLKEKQFNCCMKLIDGPKMDLVRILDIHDDDDKFTFIIVRNNSSLKKRANVTDIIYLEVHSIDSEISRVKPDVSRWVLLGDTCMNGNIEEDSE